mmetsp:Transcript_27749/g.93249  ORF Transcript_27749/g.93249 Transcript_27749/m.93249 type:complete len:283 (+) Transcript_27749:80-928(+)
MVRDLKVRVHNLVAPRNKRLPRPQLLRPHQDAVRPRRVQQHGFWGRERPARFAAGVGRGPRVYESRRLESRELVLGADSVDAGPADGAQGVVVRRERVDRPLKVRVRVEVAEHDLPNRAMRVRLPEAVEPGRELFKDRQTLLVPVVRQVRRRHAQPAEGRLDECCERGARVGVALRRRHAEDVVAARHERVHGQQGHALFRPAARFLAAVCGAAAGAGDVVRVLQLGEAMVVAFLHEFLRPALARSAVAAHLLQRDHVGRQLLEQLGQLLDALGPRAEHGLP